MPTRTYRFVPSYLAENYGSDPLVDFVMTQPSFDALIARLDGIDQAVSRAAAAIEKQNGRLTRVEHERLVEQGERQAVARVAAETAAAAQRVQTLRDKSRTWKTTVILGVLGSLGGIVVVGNVFAHVLVNL